MSVQVMVLMVLQEESRASIIVIIIVLQRIYVEDQQNIIRILVMQKHMELLVRLIVDRKWLDITQTVGATLVVFVKILWLNAKIITIDLPIHIMNLVTNVVMMLEVLHVDQILIMCIISGIHIVGQKTARLGIKRFTEQSAMMCMDITVNKK